MSPSNRRPYHFGFIIEQALGHITHGQNLQRNVALDATVKAQWALPAFEVSGIGEHVPLFNNNWTVRAGVRTRRLLRRWPHRVDALFFHTQVTAVLNRDWVRRVPSIISLDATPLQYDALGDFYAHESGSDRLEKIKWQLNRACYHAAAHLVTWSAWAKQGLIDGYGVPAERITVIPPGVNSAEWDYPQRRYDDGGGVKILFVGGNLARKGGLLLLDAFRTLRQQQPDAELHLVTRDSVLPQPGVFVYHDMQPNSVPLKRLYRACDIFCLPSYGDCLPMVLSEAGATGLPLIATDVAGMPEIARDGDTGIAIPAGDEAALTAALLRLATDMELRARFGRNARRLTQTHFDAPRNAAKLLTLLKNVADGVPITAPALPIPQPLTPNP